MSYTASLKGLVEEELVAKTDRSINARIAKARFPTIRTLEAFDFGSQPDLPGILIKEMAGPDFLVVDELGYMPVDSHRANLFFQLVSVRYEQGSIGDTTIKSFERWGQRSSVETPSSRPPFWTCCLPSTPSPDPPGDRQP